MERIAIDPNSKLEDVAYALTFATYYAHLTDTLMQRFQQKLDEKLKLAGDKPYPKEVADYVRLVRAECPYVGMERLAYIVSRNKEFLSKFGLESVSATYCRCIVNPEWQEKLQRKAQEHKEQEAARRHQRELEDIEIKKERKIRQREFASSLLDIIIPIFDKEICSSQYLSDKILEKYSCRFTQKRIENSIQTLENEMKENSPIALVSRNDVEGALYKLNKNSPYWTLCDGFAKEIKR